MTTYVNFNPSPNANFQFNLTLDTFSYVAICTFNIYSQRYYINIYDTYGNLIVARPVIGSPDNYDIDLILGYFTSTLVYRVSSQNFEINP
jgi:hypothetical protein